MYSTAASLYVPFHILMECLQLVVDEWYYLRRTIIERIGCDPDLVNIPFAVACSVVLGGLSSPASTRIFFLRFERP